MRSLLTLPGSCGFLGFPKVTGVTVAYRQHADDKNGLFSSCHQCARIGCLDILGKVTSSNREVWRLLLPGSVILPSFLSKSPKVTRCIVLRFLLSSRWTRFQYRLVSSLQSFLCHAAATAVLGAVLALPVLYFVEVL